MHSVIVVVLCLLVAKQASAQPITVDDFVQYVRDFKKRHLLEESSVYLGAHLKLNEKENKVNKILMALKTQEIEDGFNNPHYFNFTKHYFKYRNDIEKSKVYQIIKKMPKGGALHIHSSLMLHSDDLLLLTYEDHLYACYTGDKLHLRFYHSVPEQPCNATWTLLKDLREASGNVERFDAEIKKFFTLYTEDDNLLNEDINNTWERFENVYRVIKPLIMYRPVREKFLNMALKRFYDDNVMYIEIRSGLSSLYELDGTNHSKIYLAELYQRVAQKFMEAHPDFVGMKFIYTYRRSAEPKSVQEALRLAEKLKEEFPKIFAGFDLIGQEDMGRPLSDFVPVLSEAKKRIDYFFHAGETNWLGTETDENLFDALALGSKRLGHANALIKHPSLLSDVIKSDVAIEVNVISNVVLSLDRDVRKHPLATYLAYGLPIVLSSDDPGAWDADPLSHDFYVTFVGVASKKADIRLLKMLALNSINYSALDEEGKHHAYEIFEKRWNAFLSEIINTYTINE